MSWLDQPGIADKIAEKIENKNKQKDLNRFDARQIFDAVRKRVIGQDLIASRIAKHIETRSIVRKKRKPLASILISGPTGTGKTELAKSLAEAIYGSEDKNMLRIDCGNFASNQDPSTLLIGSEKVYQGSNKGLIPDFLMKQKEGVILFDEIEKAVPTPQSPLLQLMLSLLDEARIQSKYDGSVYDLSDCVIIMTSNAKQKELGEVAQLFLKDIPTDVDLFETDMDLGEMDQRVKELLQDGVFTPEFLGLVDFVSTVAPLTEKNRVYIIDRLFSRLASDFGINIKKYETDNFLDFLVEGAERFGVSNVRGANNWIEKVSGEAFVEARRDNIEDVVVGWDGNKITLKAFEGGNGNESH